MKPRRLSLCVSAMFLAGINVADCAAASDPPKPWTEKDFAALKTVTDVRIAPDASRVVYVLSEPDPTNAFYQSRIWMAEVRGAVSRRLTNGPCQVAI